nr:glycosyltransferase N-terminal domain-containing protein [Robertkochia sp. 3YJGBD-33]
MLIYNFFIRVVAVFLPATSLFSRKMKLFNDGRRTVLSYLRANVRAGDRIIWFHAASLGEFEQGLPVMEQVRADFPEHKILLTFFSPSGYEVRKNTKAADLVTYLPLDTPGRVRKFLDLVNPDMAIFIKYEFWPNYLKALDQRNIPVLLVSAIFRSSQPFFKFYGGMFRRSLRAFEQIFVQDKNSEDLLQEIGFDNVTVSGDTRFDRVTEILERDNHLGFMERFKGKRRCFVAGSTWPEGEDMLVSYINVRQDEEICFVIAPHNIKDSAVENLMRRLKVPAVCYTRIEKQELSEYRVLILDTVGLLTRVYSYADLAYVGGGMGNTGLHNTLEPAVFGIPVLIGPNYSGFREAEELVRLGGITVVDGADSLKITADSMLSNELEMKRKGALCSDYVKKNGGAIIQIGDYIRNYFSNF